MKVQDYNILHDGTSDSLIRQVKANISQGWELFGPPFFVQGFGLCQAVIKPAPFQDDKSKYDPVKM